MLLQCGHPQILLVSRFFWLLETGEKVKKMPKPHQDFELDGGGVISTPGPYNV
jgi:hypothetical protein